MIFTNFTRFTFQVPLVAGSHINLERSEIDKVLVVGRETKDNFNLMINKLLESIYSKTFLGSRSLSGGCNKKSKNDASNAEPNKPGLPEDDLNDIISKQGFYSKTL